MGGTVSTGLDNNDLIDNLRDADYIHSQNVERAFRAVDRGEYILPENRLNAYKDQAWKSNHLHLSAPCIYSEVMEGLSLSPGLNFLNLGSGTGYLNTMVGLILGSTGINHGIEFFEDVIQYAQKKLEEFKKYSGAIDEFDFCEPIFMKGNCLCLTNERRYDRVYVGAACPEEYETYMKNLLCVGGILVMPFNDQLLQIKRTSETTWESNSLLPVSFANLIVPKESKLQSLDFIEIELPPLQTLCRTVIRNIVRTNIDTTLPELKNRKHPTKRATRDQRVIEFKRAMLVPMPETCTDPPPEAPEEVITPVGEYFYRAVMARRRQQVDLERDDSLCWILNQENSDSSDDELRAMDTNNVLRVGREVVDNPQDAGEGNSQNILRPVRVTTKKSSMFRELVLPEIEDIDMSYPDEEETAPTNCNCRGENHIQIPTLAVNKWRRIDMSVDDDNETTSSSGSDEGDASAVDLNDRRIVSSPYTVHMNNQLNKLPLPPILKNFLNFYRV